MSQQPHVHIEEATRLKRASAILRDDGAIHVKVPRHWPRQSKSNAIEELVSRILQKDGQEKALLQGKKASSQAKVSVASQKELEELVQRINNETFQVPLGKVRIGHSRYSHLAQLNLQSKTMTVSRYCLKEAPEDALRYLIVHELAHYFESGHGKRFWALVSQHVPDYREQSRIMKAFHHQAVIQSEQPAKTITPEPSMVSRPTGYASRPARRTAAANSSQPVQGKQDKTGGIPGFVQQWLF